MEHLQSEEPFSSDPYFSRNPSKYFYQCTREPWARVCAQQGQILYEMYDGRNCTYVHQNHCLVLREILSNTE